MLDQPSTQIPADLSDVVDPSLSNNPAAIAQAMEKCRPYLLAVANQEIESGLRPKGGASDIVQETFLEAHCDLLQFKGRSMRDLRGWLKVILLHNVANFVRHYRRVEKRRVDREIPIDKLANGPRMRELATSAFSPIGQQILREESQLLERALGRLKERDRLVLTLRNQDYLSWTEVGDRIGGSADKARKIWSRAVIRLRDEFGEVLASSDDGSGSS